MSTKSDESPTQAPVAVPATPPVQNPAPSNTPVQSPRPVVIDIDGAMLKSIIPDFGDKKR